MDRVFYEQLMVAQLLKKLPTFMEHERSALYSQNSTNGSFSELVS